MTRQIATNLEKSGICIREPLGLVSRLTGRTILLNTSEKCLVLPTFENSRLQLARLDWEKHFGIIVSARTGGKDWKLIKSLRAKYGYHKETAEAIDACFNSKSADEFACKTANLIERLRSCANGESENTHGEARRMVETLALLCKHGLLLTPARELWKATLIPNESLPRIFSGLFGDVVPQVAEMYSAVRHPGEKRPIAMLLAVIGGLTEIGDVDEQVMAALKPFAPNPTDHVAYALCDQLLLAQRRCYVASPSIFKMLPISYRSIFTGKASHNDPQIRWGLLNEIKRDAGSSGGSYHYLTTVQPLVFVSGLTGRTVHLNASSLFHVPASFDLGRLSVASAEWVTHLDKLSKNKLTSSAIGYYKQNADLINRCFDSKTQEEFKVCIDCLIQRLHTVERIANNSPLNDQRRTGRRSGEAKRILEALLQMWRHELLLFPAAELWTAEVISSLSFSGITPKEFGDFGRFVAEMANGVRWSNARRAIRLLPTTLGGLSEIGDIDGQVIAAIRPYAPSPADHSVYSLCEQLLLTQRRFYLANPGLASLLPQSYRALFQPTPERADPKFIWALREGGERLAEWTRQVSEYVLNLNNRVGLRVELGHFNALLDYVIATESIPALPLLYCRRDCDPVTTFADFLSKARSMNDVGKSSRLRCIKRFFVSLLETHASDEHGTISLDFRNPILEEDIPSQGTRKGKTARWPIPIRFMRMLREIIEGPYEDGKPTYAWPKTIQSDYFNWLNPETGHLEEIWSPVRACFFLLRFILPIRTFQTRLLSTDEADPEMFSRESGWAKNTTRLAPKSGEKRRAVGLIRKIWDPDVCRWFNGLFITTNKTADRNEGFEDPGYEVNWENQEILDLFCYLRDWQMKHNPCLRPMSRAELLSDSHLLVSSDLEGRLDKLCFLFRDAVNPTYPQEPPTDGRLHIFWLMLLAELERRLAKDGETNLDRSPILLITAWGARDGRQPRPQSAIFDEHTIRVTGLTALIDAGVPIGIVSEFLAGHASVLMTWYYHKPWIGKVTKLLNEKSQGRSALEEEDWEDFLNNQPTELLHDLSVYNSEDGRRGIEASQSALRATMDEGVCPNGGTLCHIGGALLDRRQNVYGPVPGGSRNCVLCRFFVTGPRFIGGLSAKCNQTAALIGEKCLRVKNAEARRRQEAATAISSREAETHRRQRAADETVESLIEEVSALAITWTAQLRLIRKIKNLMDEYRGRDTNGKLPVLLNGDTSDFELALSHCSDFEMWDRICRSSVFYTSIDFRLPAIRRARLFDFWLQRAGHRAVFATLNEEELLDVGNAWSAYFRDRVGETTLGEAIDGKRTLKELGIEADLDLLVATFPSDPRTVLSAGKSAREKEKSNGNCIKARTSRAGHRNEGHEAARWKLS